MKSVSIKLTIKQVVGSLLLTSCVVQAFCNLVLAEVIEQNDQALNKTESNEAGFGRLFTTPEERKLLDSHRKKYGFLKPIVTGVDAEAKGADITPIAAQSQSLKLSGIVLRADGQQQIWINGKLQPQQKKMNINQNTNALMPTSATLKVPIQKQSQRTILKPGQVWVPGSRTTTESYLLPESRPKKIDIPVEQKKPFKVEKPIDDVKTPVEKAEAAVEPTKASE